MNPQVLKIRRHIEEEVLCYRELLEVVERERQILLSGDHGRLLPNSEQKLIVAQRLGQMQQERRQALADLSPDPGTPLKLGDLGEMLPPAERGPFRTMLAKAQGLAERMQQLSRTNKAFVDEALDTVEHLLTILSGGGGERGYNARGARPQAGGPSLPRLLTREV